MKTYLFSAVVVAGLLLATESKGQQTGKSSNGSEQTVQAGQPVNRELLLMLTTMAFAIILLPDLPMVAAAILLTTTTMAFATEMLIATAQDGAKARDLDVASKVVKGRD